MPAYRTSYAVRRSPSATRASSATVWNRNSNTVRNGQKIKLGPVSHTIIVILIVSLIGLLFVSQSSKVTEYDTELAKVDSEIGRLEKDYQSLKIENAKIMAAASDEDRNPVASTMVSASAADFVSE